MGADRLYHDPLIDTVIWEFSFQIELVSFPLLDKYRVYSYQVMEKILIWFEKKNLQHKLQLDVYASVYKECIIPFNLVQ